MIDKRSQKREARGARAHVLATSGTSSTHAYIAQCCHVSSHLMCLQSTACSAFVAYLSAWKRTTERLLLLQEAQL
jgi:hypothetical protein